MGTIFINYRRDDSQGASFSLQSFLVKQFGKRKVFIDIHGLSAGEEFDIELDRQVRACSAMIVMIGPYWLKTVDDGTRRIDQENDFVRLEISKALSLRKPILPVLVGEAKMPTPDELPDDIRDLPRFNGRPLRFERFDADAEEIAESLRQMIRRQGVSPWWMAGAAAAGLAAGAVTGGATALMAPDLLWKDERVQEMLTLQGRVAGLETERKRLNEDLHTTKDKLIDRTEQLEQAEADYTANIVRLTEDRDDLIVEVAEARRTVAGLERRLNNMTEERDRLVASAENLAADLAHRNQLFDQLMDDYNSTKQGIGVVAPAQQKELDDLRLRAEDAETRARDLANRLRDTAARITELEAAQVRAADEWVRADEHQDMAYELAALSAKYEKLTAEHAKLTEDRNRLNAKFVGLTVESSSKLVQMTADIARLTKRVETLEAENAGQRDMLAARERELAEARGQLDSLRAARKVACGLVTDIRKVWTIGAPQALNALAETCA